ncbi:MAG: hypothetical protein QME45_01380 [Clostridiales bacterium]|nr:hypothetical protein [Clostridiales bacterium]
MLIKSKRVISLVIVFFMFLSFMSACGKGGENAATSAKKGGQTVIVFGTHSESGINPEWKDPVTGKSGMSPEGLQAARKAMDTVLKQLNVKVKWTQYSGDVREVLLKSVLANDPVCDVALFWGGSQGTILGQNILQPLDSYQSIFSDPDSSWMFGDKMFGHTYFLNFILSFINVWPLVYNVQYLDKVDALKQNGKTVYPTDLWKENKWTWSAFEDYLTKVNAYYSNKKAPVRTDVPIKAFETDYRYTALQAIHANGGALYGANGLTVDSAEVKQAIQYIDELKSKNLMMSVRYGDDNPVPGWTWNANDFANGETVFTNMVPWMSNSSGQALAKRGESMGVVPFPRPDNIPSGDQKYQQLVMPSDQMGILKGVSKERTELALKAYQLYFSTYYKTLANSNKALDYFKKNAKAEAINAGFDVTNETLGEDIMKAFVAISGNKPNENAYIMPWSSIWSDQILGNSIYGLNNTPKYSAAIDSMKNMINDSMSITEKALSSSAPTDNMPPTFALVGKDIALPSGTDASKIDWNKYVKATDGVDGDIKVSDIKFDSSAVKFDKVGKYDKGLAVSAKDKAGNEGKGNFAIIVYDTNNKTAPTLKAKATYRTIAKNEDAAKINWANDFIDKAVDKDGFDLKAYVTADISQLDVTTAGKYDVVLTVKDYVGNKTDLKISVEVK